MIVAVTTKKKIVVQLPSHVQLFATPWTAACQASLSFTVSPSLLRLMFIELVIPSPPLSSPSPPAFILSWHWGLFQWVSSLHQVAEVLELKLQYEYSGLISFRMDWFDVLAVQGTLKSLLQHHNSKASILQRSAFFMVQHFFNGHFHLSEQLSSKNSQTTNVSSSVEKKEPSYTVGGNVN